MADAETRPGKLRTFFLVLAASCYILAGANHFRVPNFYRAIIPPFFPVPGALVIVSGVFEIIGGLGLLIPGLRRFAGWGLIALLIAVFPANIYMVVAPDRIADLHVAPWLLWLRLPLQGVLIVWVYLVAIRKPQLGGASGSLVK